jgi:hypothetical protein
LSQAVITNAEPTRVKTRAHLVAKGPKKRGCDFNINAS